MAIVTPNLGLTIPAMGDAPNIGVVSQALEDIDTYAGKVDDRTADAYDDSADYAVDDLCIHDNKLYKCSTAITGGEAWNSSHWTETSLADEIGSLNDQIATIEDNLTRRAKFINVGDGKTAEQVYANGSGLYVVPNPASSDTKKPYSENYYMLQFYWSNQLGMQLAFSYADSVNTAKMRKLTFGNWSNWKTITFS